MNEGCVPPKGPGSSFDVNTRRSAYDGCGRRHEPTRVLPTEYRDTRNVEIRSLDRGSILAGKERSCRSLLPFAPHGQPPRIRLRAEPREDRVRARASGVLPVSLADLFQ